MTKNKKDTMDLVYELEEDGRWLVSVDSVPGAMAYGATKEEAANAALRIAFDETAMRAAFGEDAK